ncbi:MAG: DUF547 domain-containing protein [Nitrospinaceae bacterium]|nr:MAG: DUF547 domain-containing protein [Nitrospinaceae bacterium]
MAGCATVVQPPSITQPGSGSLSRESAFRAWSQVLASSVDWQGRVDFEHLERNPSPLYEYVAYIAKVSPEKNPDKFPTIEEQLAYYINSYNALAMYGVITHGLPNNFNRLWDRAKFFKFTRFNIGGRELSLLNYENDVIRPLGDPRIHFALNCMVRACPRLPQTPFRAETLDADLDRLTREFVNDSRHVQVLPAAGLVRLSEIFRFYKKDFVNPKRASSLIAYINKYRDAPVKKKLKVEFIAYDWTVNYK